MKPEPAAPSLRRLLAGVVALAGGVLAVALTPSPVTAAATPLITLPAVPWFIGQNVAPNILLTLDDSGSMALAYAPDSFASGSSLAFKSNLNPMYYNPTVTYSAPLDANDNPYPTSYTAARRNGFDQSRGLVNLQTSYRPERTYGPASIAPSLDYASHCASSVGNCPGVNVPTAANTEAYWWTYKPNGGSCPDVPTVAQMNAMTTDACFEFKRPSTDAERQNFANWYSFYRSRNLATVSAAMIGFSKVPQDYRVAWQALNSCMGTNFTNNCRGWDTSRANVDARIGPFDGSKRAALWQWLERLPASGGTPLRAAIKRAGDYLSKPGAGSPYADDPTATNGLQYTSCRASYHVLMTDGIWNGDTVGFGNVDNTSLTLPDGTSYSPAAPFMDASANTIADLSFYYWATDLQPGIANTLRAFMPYQAGLSPTSAEYWDPRNDPGTWQKMTSIYVGLGLGNSLSSPVQWQGSTFAGTASPATGYQRFKQGLATWPASFSGAGTANVYDLWHGAINSRGAFYSADSPETLVKAFQDLTNRISSREDGASAVSSSSLQVQSDSMMFNTSFSSQRWDGTLRAYRVQSDGTPEPTVAWSTDTTFNTLVNGGIGSHKVFAKSSSGGLVQLLPTTLTSLPAARQTELAAQAAILSATMTAPIDAADLVEWVLGDKSNSELRRRDRLLGDLITSAPLFEGGRDYGYSVTAWTDTTKIDGKVYAQYVKDKQDTATGRPKNPTVYVGSNDGMLHAFNADTGAHRWAYMPSPAFAKLGKRADPLAGHNWFVDGPIVTHDIHDGTNWRTILVASTGAGARGLFALDITTATSPTLLWEYFPDDDDLGYVLGEPVIARAQSGEWIVAFGNGYGHPSNKAMLYVLNASTGAVLKKIATGEQSTTVGNGLAAPALLYTAGKRLSYAYAGDLLGNLWRIKLSGAGPSDWSLDFGNLPLFTATGPDSKPQPITAKVRIATDRQLGRMLLFGTGRLITQADPGSNDKQSIYGIRDRPDGAGTATRSDLTEQTIASETTNLRTVSQNASPISGAGWYLDLDGRPSTVGERVTMAVNYMPELSLMTVSTVRPTSAADPCGSNVTSWVMAMSPFSGQGVALFDGGGANKGAGYRLDGVLATPTPIRKSNGTVQLTINGGATGLAQVQIQRGWNPRAAWNQLR
jgi:type IV pilus assembly protein PilY1